MPDMRQEGSPSHGCHDQAEFKKVDFWIRQSVCPLQMTHGQTGVHPYLQFAGRLALRISEFQSPRDGPTKCHPNTWRRCGQKKRVRPPGRRSLSADRRDGCSRPAGCPDRPSLRADDLRDRSDRAKTVVPDLDNRCPKASQLYPAPC